MNKNANGRLKNHEQNCNKEIASTDISAAWNQLSSRASPPKKGAIWPAAQQVLRGAMDQQLQHKRHRPPLRKSARKRSSPGAALRWINQHGQQMEHEIKKDLS
jgi:hypothetical protein